MSKFLNADDTVDLIKSGVGALDEKVNSIAVGFSEEQLQDQNSYFIVSTTDNNTTIDFFYSISSSDNRRTATIDWGDGTIEQLPMSNNTTYTVSHTYIEANGYTIKIQCSYVIVYFINMSFRSLKYVKVYNDGNNGVVINYNSSFNTQTNLKELYLFDTSNTFYIHDGMFSNCINLTKIYYQSLTYQNKYRIYVSQNGNSAFQYCQYLKGIETPIGYIKEFIGNNNYNLSSAFSSSAWNTDKIFNKKLTNVNSAMGSVPTNIYLTYTDISEIPTIAGSPSADFIAQNKKIYIPKGYKDIYLQQTGWSAYEEVIEEYPSNFATKQYVDDTLAALNANSTSY